MANVQGSQPPTKEKKDLEDYGVDSSAFEALEKEFQELLDSMDKDDNLEKFKQEYEKLYRAFKTSFENEKRLVKRCKELNETILQNAVRVRAAINMTQDDAQLVTSLKKEVDKAWSMVEAARTKEDDLKKKITELRAELGHLHAIVNQGAGLPVGPDSTVQELIRSKEELKKANEVKTEEIRKLQEMSTSYQETISKLEMKLDLEKANLANLLSEKTSTEDTLKLRGQAVQRSTDRDRSQKERNYKT